jgi:hypothetical protein
MVRAPGRQPCRRRRRRVSSRGHSGGPTAPPQWTAADGVYNRRALPRGTRLRTPPTPFWLGLAGGFALASGAFVLWQRGEDRDLAHYREVRDWVRANYVRDLDSRGLVDAALHGMVESLDGYSRYYDGAQVAALERDTTGRYRGIGVVFRPPLDSARVLFALPGSPADRAGLRPGDKILAVDGVQSEELDGPALQRAIGESSGDTLELVVQARSGDTRTLRLERAELVDPTVRHAQMLDPERASPTWRSPRSARKRRRSSIAGWPCCRPRGCAPWSWTCAATWAACCIPPCASPIASSTAG